MSSTLLSRLNWYGNLVTIRSLANGTVNPSAATG
jgi:hypothetical protein